VNQVECRFCRSDSGEIVLDLGRQPASDLFPAAEDPGPDPVHPLRLWLCAACGLAQLAEDPTSPEEPKGTEPEALTRQAADAVAAVAGLLAGRQSVAEFGSPHGGSWLGLLADRGLKPANGPADVIVDCFGLMHEADQSVGLAARTALLAADGVLLIKFHSLAAILREGQWNALRHGHYAYYSTPVLVEMLRSVGLTARSAFRFPLYGGTVLIAATRDGEPDGTVGDLVAAELAAGVRDPAIVGGLGKDAADSATWLAGWLRARREAGERVVGYGAASRAVALLCRAGVDAGLLPAVADASPAKRGSRMPGTDIPVVAPDEVLGGSSALLFVPDLLEEVRRAYPQVEMAGGRWVIER
jgi:hypothetical protein